MINFGLRISLKEKVARTKIRSLWWQQNVTSPGYHTPRTSFMVDIHWNIRGLSSDAILLKLDNWNILIHFFHVGNEKALKRCYCIEISQQ